jgi:hypothetical protein
MASLLTYGRGVVRLIRVERRGKTVWVEDAPGRCPDGHAELVPTYGACPTCGEPARMWQCRAAGCDHVLVDDEHVHHGRRGLRP